MKNTAPPKSANDPYNEIRKMQNQIQALENEKKKDYEALSGTHIALANAFKDVEDWIKGEESANNAIKTAKKIKDNLTKNLKIAEATEAIGTIYVTIQDYQKGLKYWSEALDLLDKNFEALLKDKPKMPEDQFTQQTTLTKSLYIDYLKQRISTLLKLKDEKHAKEAISKPFSKFLKTKDPNCFEILMFLSDIKIDLALQLKDTDEIVRSVSELLILDFFAKKYSGDSRYWSKKFHHDIKEKCSFLIDTLKIALDEKVIGKETLNIMKLINLETKDHMYIDKILEIKQSDDFQNKILEINALITKMRQDDASPLVLSMVQNELISTIAQQNQYTEAFEKAKEIMKDIKKIKNKEVKDFLLGQTQLNLFRINVRRQDYKQAEKEGRKCIEYFEENIKTLGHACIGILELASCYIIQRRFDKAESLLERPIDFCEEMGSAELLARLYELLGGVGLKSADSNKAAIYFAASAIFYLISNDQNKYQEFLTLSINMYNRYLESIGFPTVEM